MLTCSQEATLYDGYVDIVKMICQLVANCLRGNAAAIEEATNNSLHEFATFVSADEQWHE